MSYREKDIKYETPCGRFWVLDTGKSYAVMATGLIYSTCESNYSRDDDGLSIAICRCKYLSRYRTDKYQPTNQPTNQPVNPINL